MKGFVDWLQTKITRLQLHSDLKTNQAWKISFKMVQKTVQWTVWWQMARLPNYLQEMVAFLC